MRHFLSTFLLLLLSCHGWTQNFEWGGALTGPDPITAIGIGTDASGALYTAGYFRGSVDLNPGTGTANTTALGIDDSYFCKLDSNKNLVWSGSIGGSSIDRVLDYVVDDLGNSYAIGHFQGTMDVDPGPGVQNMTSIYQTDGFILKLDSAGSLVWAGQFSTPTSIVQGQALALGPDGDVYLSGFFTDSMDVDPGPGYFPVFGGIGRSLFVARINAAGNLTWGKSFPGFAMDTYALTVDNDKNVLVTGIFHQQADFDPNAGVSTLSSVGFNDGFVCKLDSVGDFVWVRQWAGKLASGRNVKTDQPGNVYVVGHYNGMIDFDPGAGVHILTANSWSADAFLAKLDPAGNFAWVKTWSGNVHDHIYGLEIDQADNLFIAGKYTDSTDMDPGPGSLYLPVYGFEDAFVSKLDTAGNLLWAAGFGGVDGDIPADLILDHFGSVFVTGDFDGTCDLDPGPGTFNATAASQTDAFLLELQACEPSTTTRPVTACGSYLAPSGNTVWTSSGTYLDTLVKRNGCDSLLILQLTIVTVDTSVTTAAATLTANAANASFQWLDCEANLAPVPGATSATFSAAASGSFAVAVTQNGCTDTSACQAVTLVGLLSDLPAGPVVTVAPNPTTGSFAVDLGATFTSASVEVRNVVGQLLGRVDATQGARIDLQLPGASGMYLLRVTRKGLPDRMVRVWKY